MSASSSPALAARCTVPLPGGPLTGTPAELLAAATAIRADLRRQVLPGPWASVYTVRLPNGRRLTGAPGILLRLADRIAFAATPPARARVAQSPAALALPGVAPILAADPAHATVQLPRDPLVTTPAALGDLLPDPTDPNALPGPTLLRYWGCVWVPDASAPDGWRAATPEVEVRERCLGHAAVRLAVVEGVDLAADELLAVRWAGTSEPTCFLTAAQVQYARRAVAAHGKDAL